MAADTFDGAGGPFITAGTNAGAVAGLAVVAGAVYTVAGRTIGAVISFGAIFAIVAYFTFRAVFVRFIAVSVNRLIIGRFLIVSAIWRLFGNWFRTTGV